MIGDGWRKRPLALIDGLAAGSGVDLGSDLDTVTQPIVNDRSVGAGVRMDVTCITYRAGVTSPLRLDADAVLRRSATFGP